MDDINQAFPKIKPQMISVARAASNKEKTKPVTSITQLNLELEKLKEGKIKKFFPAISKNYIRKLKYVNGK